MNTNLVNTTPNDNTLVKVQNLFKSYRRGHYAVEDVSFTIPRGHIVGILGPNGCGKTSTLKMLIGLLKPTRGEILIDGKHPGAETNAWISFMPDRNFLDKSMSVRQALVLFQDMFQDFEPDKAKAMLQDMNIDEKSRLKDLSKGNLEKVQLALIMGRNAKLYVLDEPIGGVDPAAREFILKTILRNYREDAAILISTHLISEVEYVLDDVLLMRDGHILLQEPAEELREKHGSSINDYFKDLFA
ncbi:MAG: ABC transporter ATP-binding protein [Eubacteriales bacterium]|nr:ABC transporter ATP-binding protein [Eubacteriales bacterium]